MLFLTIFSVLVLFEVNIVSGEVQCSDCILLRSCQGAIDYIRANKKNPEARQKIIAADCGKQSINGVVLPKVCCSDFTNENLLESRRDSPHENLTDVIASHPNLSLLPEPCGVFDGRKIVGGDVANIYEFPWMALISHKIHEGKTKLKFVCGGTIINSRYILTAAHCVTNLYHAEVAGVRIGEFDIRTNMDCQGDYPELVCETNAHTDLAVEEVIPHKDYKRSTLLTDDIALIRLKKHINLNLKNAKPICLPVAKELRDRQITSGNKTGTVAGWGFTETGSSSNVLRKVNIPILSAADCGYPDLKKICTREINKDSCKGDSGGPLMLQDEVNDIYRLVQYGIVSSGPESCGNSEPALYTDVTKYIKWILDNIKA